MTTQKKPPDEITIRLFRFDPAFEQEPRYEVITYATEEPLSVMMLMQQLHALDPERACRTSMCFKGACGACLVQLNGRSVLGCSTLIRPGEEIRLDPHPGFKHIRDLVVDFSNPVSTEEESP